MTDNREKELKLEITEKIYRTITANYNVIRGPYNQENTFLDSPDYVLLKNMWALRIRKEEGSYILTAKGPAKKQAGYYDRPEYETVLLEKRNVSAMYNGFFLNKYHNKPCKELLQRYGNLFVSEIFSFLNTRTVIKYKGLNIEADRTVIANNIFYELEIETEKIDKAKKIISSLFEGMHWAVKYSEKGKMARAVKIFLGKNKQVKNLLL